MDCPSHSFSNNFFLMDSPSITSEVSLKVRSQLITNPTQEMKRLWSTIQWLGQWSQREKEKETNVQPLLWLPDPFLGDEMTADPQLLMSAELLVDCPSLRLYVYRLYLGNQSLPDRNIKVMKTRRDWWWTVFWTLTNRSAIRNKKQEGTSGESKGVTCYWLLHLLNHHQKHRDNRWLVIQL